MWSAYQVGKQAMHSAFQLLSSREVAAIMGARASVEQAGHHPVVKAQVRANGKCLPD
jgi:hypothetical protein